MATFHLEELETQIMLPCRLCANHSDKVIGIFSTEGISNDLPNKVNQHLPIQIAETDTLPLQCCLNCASTLLTWHEFSLSCAEAERKLQELQTIELKVYEEEAEYKEDEESPDIKLDHDMDVPDDEGLSQEELNSDKGDVETDETRIGRHRRKREEITPRHFCEVCKRGFTRKFDMERHINTKHKGSSQEKALSDYQKLLSRCKVAEADKTYYKCENCEKVFNQSYNFLRHYSIHTNVRLYFCHICGKSFRISSGLQRHITQHHYGVKKFPCEVCGKSFAAKATRDEHLNIHTNNRPFICDVCGKSFKQKASLHVHKLFHTDNFKFECHICGKKFRRAQELKVHGYLHTGHKPFGCKVCEAKFRLKPDLTRHMKTHVRLGECVCEECGSTFKHERYLKNHRKTHVSKTEMKDS